MAWPTTQCRGSWQEPRKKLWAISYRLLIGYSHNGYKTDQMKGNAWWRRVNVNASATHPPLPPPPPPPPIQQPQPPDHSTNATLCRLCRRYRSQTWKRCINSSIVLNRNRREHPQVNSSDEKFVDIPRDGICWQTPCSNYQVSLDSFTITIISVIFKN